MKEARLACFANGLLPSGEIDAMAQSNRANRESLSLVGGSCSHCVSDQLGIPCEREKR